MELLPYSPDLAEDLARSYNSIVQGVPHCYATTSEDWISFLAPLIDPTVESTLRFHKELDAQKLLVAQDRGEILGLAHSVTRKQEKEPDEGIIAFIGYKRGFRRAGQALLEASEGFLQSHGIDTIRAFPGAHRYPFYHIETAYLSDRLDHVQALLGLNGYKNYVGVGFLERPAFKSEIPPYLESYGRISTEISDRREDRWYLRVRADAGKKCLGTCECVPFEQFGSLSPEQQWVWVRWLGIDEEVQGIRLGLYLLEYALEEMYKIGYRHVVIGVDQANYRALSMYSNHGFKIFDWTYAFIRKFGTL